MEHFVTLFNSLFLPQGLALHMSMERHVREYVLWILCVDDETYEVLGRLNLPNVRRLKLSDLETPELLKVKPGRTIGEYCWTLTPFAPRFVFEADTSVDRVTYIDTDLWFLKHPKPIYDELDASGKEVLITEHAYAPEYDQSATSGRYCVQFMPFTREGGERVRKWWEERCIEWCYSNFEDGKFGDQKYLDQWPTMFEDMVYVLENKDLIQAPWNAKVKNHLDTCIYHFHGLKIVSYGEFVLHGAYSIPKKVVEEIYNPYTKEINYAIKKLEKYGFTYERNLKEVIKLIIYKVVVTSKVYAKEFFFKTFI